MSIVVECHSRHSLLDIWVCSAKMLPPRPRRVRKVHIPWTVMCSGIRRARIGTVCSISGSLPDMVATTMCPQGVTLVNNRNMRREGVFPLNSHVLRGQECHNRHRRLDFWVCSPQMILTTMYPQRVTLVNTRTILFGGGFHPEQSCVEG